MFIYLKKVSEIQNNKVCLQHYKNSFHSTSSLQMFSRITTPARRYGVAIGVGWGLKSAYDKTDFQGSLKIDREGNAEASAQVAYDQRLKVDGHYSSNSSGSLDSAGLKVKKTYFNGDQSFNLYDCSIDSVDKISLDPFTESLLQFSICVGLFIELSVIVFTIGFFYKYGFEKSYIVLRKKFQEVKKPESFSILNLFLFVIFLWLLSIDYSLTALKDHSLDQSVHIRSIYKLISELQNSV